MCVTNFVLCDFLNILGRCARFFLKGAERPSNEIEVVGSDDAAVTEPACLTARHELHQSGGVGSWATGWNIYGESDYLLTTDNVAIAGGDIPHPPWDALMGCREPLGHLAELGQGKLFQFIHRVLLFCHKDKHRRFACQGQKSVLRTLLCPQVQKRKAPLLQKLQQGGGGAGWMPLRQGIRFMKNYLLSAFAKVLKIRYTTNAARSLIDAAVF